MPNTAGPQGRGRRRKCGPQRYHAVVETGPSAVIIRAPEAPLGEETRQRLRGELASCPDVAFAHLVEVEVAGRSPRPELTLFVWLVPEAVRSLRGALNLVSEAVPRALPRERHLDVLILNSAPELLEEVEAAGCLLVECDAGERRRALAASNASRLEEGEAPPPPRRGWWPF